MHYEAEIGLINLSEKQTNPLDEKIFQIGLS